MIRKRKFTGTCNRTFQEGKDPVGVRPLVNITVAEGRHENPHPGKLGRTDAHKEPFVNILKFYLRVGLLITKQITES